jgi:hypothetical protein
MVHEPWHLGPLEQQAGGCRIGRDYPAPIADGRAIQERTLAVPRGAVSEGLMPPASVTRSVSSFPLAAPPLMYYT